MLSTDEPIENALFDYLLKNGLPVSVYDKVPTFCQWGTPDDLEEFLDEMGDKYWEGADKTSERLFGKKDFTNKDFMYKTVTK